MVNSLTFERSNFLSKTEIIFSKNFASIRDGVPPPMKIVSNIISSCSVFDIFISLISACIKEGI